MNYSSPPDISDDFVKSAEQKTAMGFSKRVIYSVLGGAFVSLGALLAIVVAGGMPAAAAGNPGVVKLLSGAVFPVGLIMVVLAGAQLFTSDCAVVPYGFFAGKVNLKKLLNVWSVVFVGNFAGAMLVAYLFAFQSGLVVNDPWKSFLVNLADAKTSAPFMKVFIKGIGANWLVCIAVWMSYSAKDVIGKIIAIWFPVMCFVVMGLEHSIANMFFIPAAMMVGADISLNEFLVSNLLPATLGNIIGGVVFVALPYWYMFGKKEGERNRKAPLIGRRPSELTTLENNLN
jgi:formate transporter